MYEYKVKEIVKVVDGDTIDIIIDLGFGMFKKERVRLNRVDAPESITKDVAEKILGLEAKEYVIQWCSRQTNLHIKTSKDDKYGRILADFFGDNNECLNDLLIENGFAWEYDGGKKDKDLEALLEKRGENT